MPRSSQASAGQTSAWNVPAGIPSPSPRSTPYACAVLAERWPGVPNLGDITRLTVDGELREERGDGGEPWDGHPDERDPSGDWRSATLWSGGFPCQDLSIAGKRRGLVGSRSGLVFAFLDLVERHRPPAILLENVPGLLSSHGGRDMAALLGRMAGLGYGVAYRVLDARYFGVPQRRRRVFIVGLRSDPDDPDGRVAADRAAAVLAIGTRCRRHPPAGIEAGEDAAPGPGGGPAVARVVTGTSGNRHDPDTDTHVVASVLRAPDGHGTPRGDGSDNLLVGASPDAPRMREADGLAGRLDDRPVVGPLTGTSGGWRVGANEAAGKLIPYRKATKAHGPDQYERWERADVSGTIGAEHMGEVSGSAILGTTAADDPLLLLGLDSHRYRVIGNGVVAPVAEWIGRRLIEAMA